MERRKSGKYSGSFASQYKVTQNPPLFNGSHSRQDRLQQGLTSLPTQQQQSAEDYGFNDDSMSRGRAESMLGIKPAVTKQSDLSQLKMPELVNDAASSAISMLSLDRKKSMQHISPAPVKRKVSLAGLLGGSSEVSKQSGLPSKQKTRLGKNKTISLKDPYQLASGQAESKDTADDAKKQPKSTRAKDAH